MGKSQSSLKVPNDIPTTKKSSRKDDAAVYARHPLPALLDLCLYRAVNEHCGGHVLPFGVRQKIKDYAWASFDNATLQEAVNRWCDDREDAERRYGDINDWDVSRVTDMASLFSGTNFNHPIDRWDVRNVRAMDNMFAYSAFNQRLDAWEVGQVTSMTTMFEGAASFNQPLSSWNVQHVTDMTGMFKRKHKCFLLVV